MRILLTLAIASLALSSCKLGKLFEPSPERQLGRLLTAHPELAAADTVTIHDTITVPQVHVETKFVYRANPAREHTDSLRLDSLLQKLETHLDTASRRATVREVFQYVRTERPRFPDTLCFDTLGLRGKVWRTGSAYQISLTRKEIRQPHAARAVVARLKPCDCAPLVWYDPRTWPYGWLLCGILIGLIARFRQSRSA
ncbi:hypothetical protein Q5H93_21720 [Hymenobacter sp. ASUV-10]|uniref:Lipoprotein n=1 Tax=Hymenobacter aranciens TaxID=3063996 RepID=A0ABT9BHU8_9BACT|nr:hypothetical protein [Hymenobacter sp. ASUV-10]MDO7877375.1 hypothetical protein [Hymenobacter sp. ASUV-10]